MKTSCGEPKPLISPTAACFVNHVRCRVTHLWIYNLLRDLHVPWQIVCQQLQREYWTSRNVYFWCSECAKGWSWEQAVQEAQISCYSWLECQSVMPLLVRTPFKKKKSDLEMIVLVGNIMCWFYKWQRKRNSELH